jgi:hypothetical protein
LQSSSSPDSKEFDPFELKEWDQCRQNIANLDKIISDLRKYGFTVVTGLLSVGAFLTDASNGAQMPDTAKAGAAVAIMLLIGALFLVDRYYVVQQVATGERAMAIEHDAWAGFALKWMQSLAFRESEPNSSLIYSEPPGLPDENTLECALVEPKYMTERLNRSFSRSMSVYVALVLYSTLLVTTLAVGLIAVAARFQMPFTQWQFDVAYINWPFTLYDIALGAASFALLVSAASIAKGIVKRLKLSLSDTTDEAQSSPAPWTKLGMATTVLVGGAVLALMPMVVSNTMFESHPARSLILIGAVTLSAIFGYFVFTEHIFETSKAKGGQYFSSYTKVYGLSRKIQERVRTSVSAVWSFSNYERGYFVDTLDAARSTSRGIQITRIIDATNLKLSDIANHIWEVREFLLTNYRPLLACDLGFEMVLTDRSDGIVYLPIGARSKLDEQRKGREQTSLWAYYVAPMHINIMQSVFEKAKCAATAFPSLAYHEFLNTHSNEAYQKYRGEAWVKQWIIGEVINPVFTPAGSYRSKQQIHYFAYGTDMDCEELFGSGIAVRGRRAARLCGYELEWCSTQDKDGRHLSVPAAVESPTDTIEGAHYVLESTAEDLCRLSYISQSVLELTTRDITSACGEAAFPAWVHLKRAETKVFKPNPADIERLKLAGADLFSDSYFDHLESKKWKMAVGVAPTEVSVCEAVEFLMWGTNFWSGTARDLADQLSSALRAQGAVCDDTKDATRVEEHLRRNEQSLRQHNIAVEWKPVFRFGPRLIKLSRTCQP